MKSIPREMATSLCVLLVVILSLSDVLQVSKCSPVEISGDQNLTKTPSQNGLGKPSRTNGTSLVDAVLPTEIERQLDKIKSCEPTLTLMNGQKKDLASFITSKYGGQCLDNILYLELSSRGMLREALNRNDKKADTIVCHKFVELFKAVELKDLTRAMCSEGVISQVSDEFCTSGGESSKSLETRVDSVVKNLRENDLIKIAIVYQFLHKIKSDEMCSRVCGGNDKVFCNAYVRLVEFFLKASSSHSSTAKAAEQQQQQEQPQEQQQQEQPQEQQQQDQPQEQEQQDQDNNESGKEGPPVITVQQPSHQDTDALFDRIKVALESESVSLSDLKELRATIDDASKRVFRYKLHEVFPFMLPDQLDAATSDEELLKFILDSVIKKRAKSQTLFPQPNFGPSFIGANKEGVAHSTDDSLVPDGHFGEGKILNGGAQNDHDNDGTNWHDQQPGGQTNEDEQTNRGQLGQDHEDQPNADEHDDNGKDTQLDGEGDQTPPVEGLGLQTLDAKVEDQLPQTLVESDNEKNLKDQEEDFSEDGRDIPEGGIEDESDELYSRLKEQQLLNKESTPVNEEKQAGKQVDHQPEGLIIALNEEDKKQKESENLQVDAERHVADGKHGSYGSWHFLSMFLFFAACVVIGYVFIVKRKKLREGLGTYLADGNGKRRMRTRDYKPL